MGRYKAIVVAYTSLIMASGSFILFAVFLFMGRFNLIDLKMSDEQAIFFDGFLSIVFFIQHSVMIRRWFRKRLARIIPDAYDSAIYSIASSIILIAVILLWQYIPPVIYKADGALYWSLRILYFLCIAGFYWGSTSLSSMDPSGYNKIKRFIRKRETRKMPLALKGPYRWVRHPLYLFMIVMIWSFPEPTLDRMLFNVLWSLWIIIGTLLEERDLVREFGEDYRRYQKTVPMIVPFKIPARMV